ncbi:MAG TPA: hypothetical protein VK555_10065 [Terriglobales bacterium]|nr:hypothetical protein [Terriglobales bacterium]
MKSIILPEQIAINAAGIVHLIFSDCSRNPTRLYSRRGHPISRARALPKGLLVVTYGVRTPDFGPRLTCYTALRMCGFWGFAMPGPKDANHGS